MASRKRRTSTGCTTRAMRAADTRRTCKSSTCTRQSTMAGKDSYATMNGPCSTSARSRATTPANMRSALRQVPQLRRGWCTQSWSVAARWKAGMIERITPHGHVVTGLSAPVESASISCASDMVGAPDGRSTEGRSGLPTRCSADVLSRSVIEFAHLRYRRRDQVRDLILKLPGLPSGQLSDHFPRLQQRVQVDVAALDVVLLHAAPLTGSGNAWS